MIDTMRVERAGQLGMSIAIHKGAETMEEIAHQTLKKAIPALLFELDKLIMGESENLRDAATCRDISQQLKKAAEAFG